MPTYPNWLAGARITAGQLNAGLPLTVVKAADEPVTSSTGLQNDNELLIAVPANSTWQFDCYLDYEGGTQGASDIKWTWTVPASATLRYGSIYVSSAGVATQRTQIAGDTVVAGTTGAGNLRSAIMHGSFVVGATPGTLTLQWAQNTSSVTPTIVHAQSTLTLLRTS